MPVKKSATKTEYNKQRRRIMRQINSMIGRGYEFTPQQLNKILPPIPKRITKGSVRRLSKIKTEDIYKNSRFYDENRDKYISGIVARDLQRSRSARKAAQSRAARAKTKPEERQPHQIRLDKATRQQRLPKRVPDLTGQVIENFRKMYGQFPKATIPAFDKLLETMIQKYGEGETAQVIMRMFNSGDILTYDVAYNNEKRYAYISRFLNQFEDMGTHEKQDIIDAFEEWETWGDEEYTYE